LKNGSEVWALNKNEYQQLGITEMKFLRSLLGLTRLDYQRNTTIREKLKVAHIIDEIQNYQKNWLPHVKRMEHARIPRMALANTTQADQKQDGETNSIFPIEFQQDRT
jgi:hypothetical protein